MSNTWMHPKNPEENLEAIISMAPYKLHFHNIPRKVFLFFFWLTHKKIPM